MSNDAIISLLGRAPRDPDLQAGSRGLSLREVVERYFSGPGQLLELVRIVRGKSVEDLSAETRIELDTLRAYEASRLTPSPKDTVALSKALDADLKAFLNAFGALEHKTPDDYEPLGIAAQFAGELSDAEKLDLKKVIEAFAAKRRER